MPWQWVPKAKAQAKPKAQKQKAKTKKPAGKPRAAGPKSSRDATAKGASWYLNPFVQETAPASATSIGPFSLVKSVNRFALSTSTVNDTWVVMLHTTGGVKAFSFVCAPAAGSTSGNLTVYTAPQLVSSGFNDSSSIRPLRSALKIRNSTVFTSLAGEVQIYKIANHYDWSGELTLSAGNVAITAAMMDQLKVTMDSSMRTRSVTGARLVQQHIVIAAPASHQGYNEWLDAADQFSTASYNPPGVGAWIAGDITTLTNMINDGGTHDPMEAVIVRMKVAATVQNYGFTLAWHDAVRMPEGSYGMSNAVHQPKGNQTAINAVHEAVSGSGIFNEETGAAVLGTLGVGLASLGRGALMGARAVEAAAARVPLLAIGAGL